MTDVSSTHFSFEIVLINDCSIFEIEIFCLLLYERSFFTTSGKLRFRGDDRDGCFYKGTLVWSKYNLSLKKNSTKKVV